MDLGRLDALERQAMREDVAAGLLSKRRAMQLGRRTEDVDAEMKRIEEEKAAGAEQAELMLEEARRKFDAGPSGAAGSARGGRRMMEQDERRVATGWQEVRDPSGKLLCRIDAGRLLLEFRVRGAAGAVVVDLAAYLGERGGGQWSEGGGREADG